MEIRKLEGRDVNREKVRARDKYTCQLCKKVWVGGQRRFDIHHLNGLCGKKSRNYDKEKDFYGLITYCHKCHLSLHSVRIKMGGTKVSKKRKASNFRVQKTLELRNKGLLFKEIGKELNITIQSANRIYLKAVDKKRAY